MDSDILFTNSGYVDLYSFRWCLIVAFNKKGLDDTPNMTRVNFRIWTSGWDLATSSNQRNCRTSWSRSSTHICQECSLNISSQGNFWSPESQQNVHNPLVKLGPCVDSRLERGQLSSLMHHRQFVFMVLLYPAIPQHGGANSVLHGHSIGVGSVTTSTTPF